LADALLVLLVLSCVAAPLLLGRVPQVVLPGGHLSVGLTPRSLLVLCVAAGVRLCAGGSAGAPATFRWRLGNGVTALATGAVCLLTYLNAAQPRAWPSGDTIPSKLLPISLIEENDLDLDEFVEGVPFARRYGFHRSDGHFVSAYPVATALSALPIYALGALAFPDAFATWRLSYATRGGDDLPNVATLMEQWSSGLMAAACVVAFWWLCFNGGRDRARATGLALAWGLGTSLMSTASQALWQHGPACLGLAVCLLALQRSEGNGSARALAGAGLAAGWAFACRPTVFVIAAVFALWTVLRHGRKAGWFAVPCAAVAGAALFWNYRSFQSVAGGYTANLGIFAPFSAGALVSLLFSPSRGLFVFSPFLLAGFLPGLRDAIRKPASLSAFCWHGAAATAVLFACWRTWAGGATFGPRYLCEAALLLAAAIGLAPCRRRLRRCLLVWSVLFSCYVHIVGARHGDYGWTEQVFRGDDFPTMWNACDSQIAWTVMGGRPCRGRIEHPQIR
jgi:hypothetical protein